MYSELDKLLVPGTPLETVIRKRAESNASLTSEIAREEWSQGWLRDHRDNETAIHKIRIGPETWSRIRRQRLSDGSMIAWHSDISGLKRAEAALVESEERFRRSFEDALVGMTILGLDNKYRHANRAFCDWLGYSLEEVRELSLYDVLHPAERKIAAARRERHLAGGEFPDAVDRRYLRKDGTIVWGSLMRSPVCDENGEILYSIGQIQDVTERKLAEDALRESEERFRDFANSAADRFWQTDVDHRFTYMSPVPEDSRMLPTEEVIGKRRWELEDPTSSAEFLARQKKLMDARQPYRDIVRRVLRDDGQEIVVRVTGRPFYDNDGNFKGYRGTTVDDTERFQAEIKAASAQAQFQSVVEQMPEGITLWDSDERFVMCNSEFRAINPDHAALFEPGISFEALLRKQFDGQLAGENCDSYEVWAADRIKAFREEFSDDEFLVNDRWYFVRCRRLPDGSVIGIHSDITEIKRREEALRHAQKMEAVGQLTGGVAHDFNNLLAGILGNLELIGERVKSSDPALLHRVERAIRAAQRGGILTNRLLAFSRRQNLEPCATNIGVLVDGMTDLLRRTLGEAVDIRFDVGEAALGVLVDPN